VALAWRSPHGNRDLAGFLASGMVAGDRVVMVDQAFYDVSFYARLSTPPVITSDWADPRVALQDNWRKELADAARFEPGLGRTLLRPASDLAQLACGQGATWFVVARAKASKMATVSAARLVFERQGTTLWRAPMQACN
jgi:hypothetical protein